ncbi:Tex family protein [Marinicella sp. S1101]|uniref:Tex family protein n=1 Tax=Marinicella marina TaxID=2996016 RepID=UPI002260C65A|nr:Tex family protein [Marinicella marina]MCX7552997.1 Tex family protein [Marinicella marina]MDJ1139693.1 Tex family protein [Marinicella marina]
MSLSVVNSKHVQIIAAEINAQTKQIQSAIELLDGGDTVPFIARYRKEVTGGLDDTQLRQLEERLGYLRELDDRRETIIKAIEEQGKLTDALQQSIMAADTKTRLEDLYLPYKKKRQTKAQKARLAGLEPLLAAIIAQPEADESVLAEQYINTENEDETLQVKDAAAALDGARQIALEDLSEDADLIQELREWLWRDGVVIAKVMSGQENEPKAARFKDYFEFSEAINKIPSHRMLALLRGRNEGVLSINIDHRDVLSDDLLIHPAMGRLVHHTGWDIEQSQWLHRTTELAWKAKLQLKLNLQLLSHLREQSDEAAIQIFNRNLKDLLLAAPAGGKVTLGLDPGFRTGVKTVVVDGNGKLLESAVIFPHAPQKQWEQAKQVLVTLCQKHAVKLIAIGNGTASRETDQLAAEIIKQNKDIKAQKIMVSEAGASVYSASAMAAKEFPDLDVSYRGAVSIARRLQDPLAELVKIDPKAIGVGQYQHDVNQAQLSKALGDCVEDCVNKVGVDVNTASAPLLKYVAGVSESVAQEIVKYRDANGSFNNRKQLLKVSRLGEKMFEQCAGFLRIRGGDQPLDQSAVHPEAYPLVENMLAHMNNQIEQVIGQTGALSQLNPNDFANDQYGVATIKDVIEELKKPGRDPRGEFKTATFDDQVHEIKDLAVGMRLEGVVTNVTAFGAFVDIGVHQDGLVHISELADQYVKDPADVVKAGQVIKVRVLEVDVQRKRISLSAKSPDGKQSKPSATNKPHKNHNKKPTQHSRNKPAPQGAFAGALADAFKKAKK